MITAGWGRWLPWAVAGLLALLVLLAPRGTEGLAVHDKAVACVESGKVWLNGQCCSSYDGATQKCKKGSSSSSKKGSSSSSSRKKGSSSSGKKGSGKKGSKTTTDDGDDDTSGDDEPKPKKKSKGGGGGGKTVEARYHTYKTRGFGDGNGIGDTSCADELRGRGDLEGKPWVALTSMSDAKCGKKARITNKATGKSVVAYIVDTQGAGGVDLDRKSFNEIDGKGTNGGSGQGVLDGHMDVTVEEL